MSYMIIFIGVILLSVSQSVHLSAKLYIVIKQYILQQKVSEQVNRKCCPRNSFATFKPLH